MEKYTCICNKSYTFPQNLSRHRQTCAVVKQQALIQQPGFQIMFQQFMLQQPLIQPVLQQPQEIKPAPFCLNDYLSELIPLSIDFLKSKYTPSIKDFNNVLVNGITTGIYKNITNYLSTYELQQMPIVVTNVQSARFKMMVYINRKWVLYEKQKAMDYLNTFVNYFIIKLFKYMSVFYTEYPNANTPYANETPDYCKRLSLYSLLGNSDKYLSNVSLNLKEFFIINKENEDC